MKTWILVANSAEAKLLSTDNLRVGELTLVRELTHPESRQKGCDLMSDKSGHYSTAGSARGAFSDHDPKEVEAEHFAIQLAHELKVGWGDNQYENLLIVTPAHFYGVLKKHLHDNSAITITHLSKDYTKHALPELHSSLKEMLFV